MTIVKLRATVDWADMGEGAPKPPRRVQLLQMSVDETFGDLNEAELEGRVTSWLDFIARHETNGYKVEVLSPARLRHLSLG